MGKFYWKNGVLCADVACPDCGIIHSVSHKNYYAQRRGIRNLSFRCAKCGRLRAARTRRDPTRRKTTEHGYVKMYQPENAMSDKRGEVYLHRLVMSEHLGRPLHRYEHVHHKDGNRSNNCVENLELVTNSENHVLRDAVERIAYLEALLAEHGVPFKT